MRFIDSLEPRQLLALTLPDGFEQTLFTGGLNTPTSMVFAPDGRLFVAEKSGDLRIITRQGRLLPKPMLSLEVDVYRERGLDGIVLDPDFERNGHLYLYYTTPDPARPNQESNSSRNRLSRFTISGNDLNRINPGSERILLDGIGARFGVHNGGALAFGADGMLYIGVGDEGVSANSVNLNNLNGKILRIDPDAFPNVIPDDNPFAGQAGRRGEIWAFGLRNPFTAAIKPGTSLLYANDVGQNGFEEVNVIVKGGNYGWPSTEGHSSVPAHTDPLHAYTHGPGAAITGGTFYTAEQFPRAYRGHYFFADYVQRFISTIGGNGNVHSFATDANSAIDLDVGPDGSLYYISGEGGQYDFPNTSIYRISFERAAGAGGNEAPLARARATPRFGQTPLNVNFDASRSSDPDDDTLTFRWNFGDGSKSVLGDNVNHTYSQPGRYRARLFAYDGNGHRTVDRISITAGSVPPEAQIFLPEDGSRYSAGSEIRFSGRATDADDGIIPRRRFVWTVVFHHNTHTHPFLPAIRRQRQGSFEIPRTGEVDPDQFYRVHLTVKDSSGLVDTTHVDIRPRTSQITLAGNFEGLVVRLDGQSVATPGTVTGVVGMLRTVSAPLEQEVNGTLYRFARWSDGGDRSHDIEVPFADSTLRAIYRQVS